MVPLNEKILLDQLLLESPKAFALFSYLSGKEINTPQDGCSETDRTYYSMLNALRTSNKNLFKQCYDDLSQRRVLKELPIIYDNYLLFVLITGVTKFNLNGDWIKSVIVLRDTNNEPEKAITASFNHLLNKNYLTTEGIPSIILATLIKQEGEINTTILRNSFEANKGIGQYLERDLFLTSIYLYTSDYIISISIGQDGIDLKKFEGSFLRKIGLLQNLLYVFILILLVLLWFYLVKHYPQIKELANTLGILLQLIGIGLLAFGLNKIKSLFGKLLKLFFGYKK